jgi:20S proteasome subunit beta 7
MNRGLLGSTAIAFKYRDGVITATDTAVSYGSVSIPNMTKIFKITEKCIVSFSGKMADVHFLRNLVMQEISNDEREMDPQGIHKMIQRIMYSRRSRNEPLLISALVIGVHMKENKMFQSTSEDGRFVGAVNFKGNFWFDSSVATGIASHIALPLIREANVEEMSKEDAIAFMEHCLKILSYRDCRASNKIQIGIVENGQSSISESYAINTDWAIGLKEGEIVLE